MIERERTVRTSAAGYTLLWLSEFAGVAALLTIPVWLLHLSSPVARPGSAIMLGPAVMVTAVAATQLARSRLRAAFTLTALAAAASMAAAVWPLPAPTWVAAYATAKLLRYGADQLAKTPGVRVGAGTMLTALVATIAVGDVAHLTGSAAWSLSLVTNITAFMAFVLAASWGIAIATGFRSSPTLDRLASRWESWRVERLRRRGLQPLEPGAAPVLYRRVEKAGERVWSWEVRDGQTTVDCGSAPTRAGAERAANAACFSYTFRPPTALRPGALYVLATKDGNPFLRQVVDICPAERGAIGQEEMPT